MRNSGKEQFICDTLLPYCLRRIENAADNAARVTLQRQIATMKVFPYLSEGEVIYGALKEPGIRWYYVSDREPRTVKSTESYRILDRSRMKPDLFQTFRQVFGAGGCAYIQEFSDRVVVEDLVRQMGKETEYTAKWWSCAADAFALWNPRSNPGSTLQEATARIRTSYLLYDDGYCEPSYQQLLSKYRIMDDIRKTDGYRGYIAGLTGERKRDAHRFLEYLGVRTSFIREESWNQPDICAEIASLFYTVSQLSFPVSAEKARDFELCRISEYLYFKVLAKENPELAARLLENTDRNGGIVMRNVRDAFMPCTVSLFYLPEEYDARALPENKLNRFLVKQDAYEAGLLDMAAHSIEFMDGFDAYTFGDMPVHPLSFYKWAWQFSRQEGLAEHILLHLASLARVEASQQAFVLDVLQAMAEASYGAQALRPCCTKIVFTMKLSGSQALAYSRVLDLVHRSENYQITFQVTDRLIHEPLDIKYRILQAVENQVSAAAAKTVETDPFWDRVYLLKAPEAAEQYYGRYAAVQYHDKETGDQGDIVLLCQSDDANSYLEAVCAYIASTHSISLYGVAANWKAEYYNLVRGVDAFLCDHAKADVSSDDEILFRVSEMADVSSLAHEYKIWDRFQREKKAILDNRIMEIDLTSWRTFLNSKYHGRCQLCGSRTASGIENAHFWTYRIIKESKSDLANLHSNIFCLCSSCHGELSYGFRGKDLTQIKVRAQEYLEQLYDCMEEDLDDLDETESIVSSFADTDTEYEGFHAPVICDVTVNGTDRKMAFSWEHFMRIAFLLSGLNDGAEDDG